MKTAAGAMTLLAIVAQAAAGAAPEPSNAITWRAPIEVAAGAGHKGAWRQNDSRYDYVDDPTVAFDRTGATAVAWVDQRAKDVFLQVFEAGGRPRFAQAVNVSRTPDVFSWLPRIVFSPVHARDVYVLWQEIVFSGGSHGGDIYFARSVDGGATFGKPTNLSRSRGGDGKGRITREIWHNGSLDLAVAHEGTLYAAWTEYDGPLWFARSSDRGERFSAPILVAGAGRTSPARAPSLAAGRESTVYLAWTVGEDRSADIRIARSADGGRSFGKPVVVAQTKNYSDAPKIAVDAKGVLHIVHAESAGGPFERYHVRYSRSRDGAQTFEAGRDISRPERRDRHGAAFPSLALDGHDNVYVLWEVFLADRPQPRGLALVHSNDGGVSFSTPAEIPESSDAGGGFNGSQQGLLMRKLAATNAGKLAVVNSSLKENEKSRVWLLRGSRANGAPP